MYVHLCSVRLRVGKYFTATFFCLPVFFIHHMGPASLLPPPYLSSLSTSLPSLPPFPPYLLSLPTFLPLPTSLPSLPSLPPFPPFPPYLPSLPTSLPSPPLFPLFSHLLSFFLFSLSSLLISSLFLSHFPSFLSLSFTMYLSPPPPPYR